MRYIVKISPAILSTWCFLKTFYSDPKVTKTAFVIRAKVNKSHPLWCHGFACLPMSNLLHEVDVWIVQKFAGKVAFNHRLSSVKGGRGLRDRARPPSGVFTNRLRRDAGVQAKNASAPPRLTYPPSWTKVHIPLHLPGGCVQSFFFARSSWVWTT